MNRYICIHGHFYQPPRENPWLEAIELQDSAYPYGDWNERITAECYLPNAESRILDSKERIINIVNNYAKISFNFGPTLLSWMEKHSPDVYQAILDADKQSREKFLGHGAALAQGYNHMILPLANARDKRTQILWGIKDFEFRFQRKPEGMWLPETAVDIATLEVLAEFDIRFTILSPFQAMRVRKMDTESWEDVTGGKVDPKRPYLCRLPSGKTIALFFYDGPISQDVAFGDLSKSGVVFADRLMGAFGEEQQAEPTLVHIANDGETYGHHQKFANMALSYLMEHIEKHHHAKVTIYGEYLEKFPPAYEAEIIENSSWSCAHGIERWRSNCGCCIGEGPDWNQKWRAPLREALDTLRDKMIKVYETEMSPYSDDPWSLRDQYIDVILNRTAKRTQEFLKAHFKGSLKKEDSIKILRLLEMQRQAMLMYTSCGWFFDDVSRIETLQILQYAARAIQLAREVSGVDLEKDFIAKLKKAHSNIEEIKNGQKVYERYVVPAVKDYFNVTAHYAILSLFEKSSPKTKVYSYTIDRKMDDRLEVGKQTFLLGTCGVISEITGAEKTMDFALWYLGDHRLTVGVQKHADEGSFASKQKRLKTVFQKKDMAKFAELMNDYFTCQYSLWDLFKNDQEKAMNNIFKESLDGIEGHFRQIFDQYYPLVQIKKDLRIPLPRALAMTIEYVLNRDFCELIESDDLPVPRLKDLAGEIKRWSFMRDKERVSLIASQRVDRLMKELRQSPKDERRLKKIDEVLRIFDSLDLDLNLWTAQNIYFSVGKKLFETMKEKAQNHDTQAKKWIASFARLGSFLMVRVPPKARHTAKV